MYFYYFNIADLNIKMESPIPVAFQKCMKPFQSKDQDKFDMLYKIAKQQGEKAQELILKREYSVFRRNNQYVRVKNIQIDGHIKQIFLHSNASQAYYIDIPAEALDNDKLFERENVLDFLALEEVLLFHDAFLLHSSFVSWRKTGIVFTAPSGTGKSTQANLWQQYEGAEIYNGDRTIIRKIDNVYHGFGSPYAGSSGIYRNETAPIKAIIVLTQAPENRIERLTGKQAFTPLYKETLMNTWNPEYMNKMTDLLMDVAAKIPIYHLACRPDREAVELVKKTLFQE